MEAKVFTKGNMLPRGVSIINHVKAVVKWGG